MPPVLSKGGAASKLSATEPASVLAPSPETNCQQTESGQSEGRDKHSRGKNTLERRGCKWAADPRQRPTVFTLHRSQWLGRISHLNDTVQRLVSIYGRQCVIEWNSSVFFAASTQLCISSFGSEELWNNGFVPGVVICPTDMLPKLPKCGKKWNPIIHDCVFRGNYMNCSIRILNYFRHYFLWLWGHSTDCYSYLHIFFSHSAMDLEFCGILDVVHIRYEACSCMICVQKPV